jgi:quinol monooxygenase YgiN
MTSPPAVESVVQRRYYRPSPTGPNCHQTETGGPDDPEGAAVPEQPSEREVETTLVTMEFDDADALLGVLSKYVVLTRGHDGCRNVDLCRSVTRPDRYVVVQKWAHPDDQRRHFDSPEMVEMARACAGLLASPPRIDLLEGISAHDLA